MTAGYRRVSRNVVEALNPHQAYYDRLPEKAKDLIAVRDELYPGWNALITDIETMAAGRPYMFKLDDRFCGTPEDVADTLLLARTLAAYEADHDVVFDGGDSPVKKRQPLDYVEGRNDFDIGLMADIMATKSPTIQHVSFELYPVNIRAIDTLHSPIYTIPVDFHPLLAALSVSNVVFPKNNEVPPYKHVTLPEQWLTNRQFEITLFEYLKKYHKSIAEDLWHALKTDIEKCGYCFRPDTVPKAEFFERFEEAKALAIEDITLDRHIHFLDRFTWHDQVDAAVRQATYTVARAMERQELIERMGAHELSACTWLLPRYEILRGIGQTE
jgi:hypothetical protein